MTTIQWVFSGIGVLGLVLLGRLFIFLWKRRRRSRGIVSEQSLASDSPAAAQSDTARFSKPTPDEMTAQVASLPPFQQEAGWEAYSELEVCWQTVFHGINEDEPANTAAPTAKKKWVVELKHYDPSIRYAQSTICCPGIDIDKYPQFKSLHQNELVIVKGRLESLRHWRALLYPVEFEFCGKRIK